MKAVMDVLTRDVSFRSRRINSDKSDMTFVLDPRSLVPKVRTQRHHPWLTYNASIELIRDGGASV